MNPSNHSVAQRELGCQYVKQYQMHRIYQITPSLNQSEEALVQHTSRFRSIEYKRTISGIIYCIGRQQSDLKGYRG